MKNEFYSRKTEKKALDVGLAVRLEEPMMMSFGKVQEEDIE
jgi:hypothetical protein